MEFCPNLSKFQGVLTSADSVHAFSKLISKGGNEDKIQYVLQCLQNFLQKEKHIVENTISEDSIQTMRKFAFYIILNSDLTILEELVDLDSLDIFIWTIATVPKYLMCEILWNLNFDKFIYEIIVFSCPKLALEVAEALIANFKYFNPTDCLQKLQLLSSACYRLICRLIFFQLESDTLTHAMKNFQNCLKYFSEPPNCAKLDMLEDDEVYKFTGKRFCSILHLISDCFGKFVGVHKLKADDFQEVYELTYTEGSVINEKASIMLNDKQAPIDSALSNCINQCHILLLDKCEYLVKDISVETFCAWSEFEENSKSMQQTIMELCYKVHTTLSGIESVTDHPLIGILQQNAAKPLDVVDIINETDPEVIISNIGKEDYVDQWIKALIYRENLCQEPVLLDAMSNHLKLLDENECSKLFKIIYNFQKNSATNEATLQTAIKVFQLCSNSFKQEMVEEHFSNDCFNDTLLTSEFSSMTTEIFNKLIVSPDTDLCHVLTIFIQSPRKVFMHIFTLASENKQQTDIMLRVMKLLEKYSKHFYNDETEGCLISITKEVIRNDLDTEKKQSNFIRFIHLIKTNDIIPGHKLLLLVIMPNLHQALLNKDITSLYIHCKLLQAAYPNHELLEYRAPILAMIAQVLDTVRWKINTFVPLRPVILDLMLKLQVGLINTYSSGDILSYDIPEKELNWLKIKLRNINPLNMYYYKCLWNPPGSTFVEVISGIRIHKDMDMEQLTLWLSQVLCSTTLGEWYQIWDSLTVFRDVKVVDIFHDALLLIIVGVKSKYTESSKACLFYCMTNFVATIRYKFLKEPVNESQIGRIFNKFATIENLMIESDVKELSTIFLPLFAFMSSTKDLPKEITCDLLGKLKHKVFIDMVENLFIKCQSNMST